MSASYIRQSLADLRFAVYGCTLGAAHFNILDQRTIKRPGFTATLWVIGSSHILNIETPDFGLAEVLTAAREPLPAEGQLDVKQATAPQQLRHQVGPFAYRAELRVHRCAPDEFLHEEARLLTPGDAKRLVHRFPTGEGLVSAPLTVAEVLAADDGRLEIETFHSYAEELALVRTHTTVTISGAASATGGQGQ